MAFAVNDPGQAVGYSSGPTGVRAVVWTLAGAIQALPALPGSKSSRGLAINDRGDAVGVSDTPSGPRAVLWGGGAVQDLGTLPGHGASEALSINNSGDIVGSSGDPEAERRAVLWARAAAPSRISAPSRAARRAGRSGSIIGGEVVGTHETSAGDHAFLWTEQDGMQDLNELLTSRSGFVLTHAVAISPQGVIVAIGVDEATSAEQRHDHDDHELPTPDLPPGSGALAHAAPTSDLRSHRRRPDRVVLRRHAERRADDVIGQWSVRRVAAALSSQSTPTCCPRGR